MSGEGGNTGGLGRSGNLDIDLLGITDSQGNSLFKSFFGFPNVDLSQAGADAYKLSHPLEQHQVDYN